jgi:hypothetical protein
MTYMHPNIGSMFPNKLASGEIETFPGSPTAASPIDVLIVGPDLSWSRYVQIIGISRCAKGGLVTLS